MNRKIRSFLHDAPRGREYRVDVRFECNKCGQSYRTLRGALLCTNKHKPDPMQENTLKPYINVLEQRFQNGELPDFTCLLVVETPSGNHFQVTNSEVLLTVLEDNADWMLPRNYGSLMWNTMQWGAVVLLTALSSAGMAEVGYKGNYLPFGVLLASWAMYVAYYRGQRREGRLGAIIPLVPWRIAVVLLVITAISFGVGRGLAYYV